MCLIHTVCNFTPTHTHLFSTHTHIYIHICTHTHTLSHTCAHTHTRSQHILQKAREKCEHEKDKMESEKSFTPDMIRTLFCNIEEILAFHKDLMIQLNTLIESKGPAYDTKIASCYTKQVSILLYCITVSPYNECILASITMVGVLFCVHLLWRRPCAYFARVCATQTAGGYVCMLCFVSSQGSVSVPPFRLKGSLSTRCMESVMSKHRSCSMSSMRSKCLKPSLW